ncbi:Hypothetical predicted protein [Octopus vulgaris]|uniref:Uncharacterized protein n=1 Tax=Octopus vulgaris TaxID=6645 RepID=A0AA36F307_OCTVU|nr:Hypothetical predicted protein [Octopus vulgaris]
MKFYKRILCEHCSQHNAYLIENRTLDSNIAIADQSIWRLSDERSTLLLTTLSQSSAEIESYVCGIHLFAIKPIVFL